MLYLFQGFNGGYICVNVIRLNFVDVRSRFDNHRSFGRTYNTYISKYDIAYTFYLFIINCN